jgi:hypothetical protein
VAAGATEVLHLLSGSLQAFSIAADTGLVQDNITDVLPLSTLAGASNPPGGATSYNYIDPSAHLDIANSAWIFTFASAPTATSSIAAQTFYWYLAASTTGDVSGDYNLFRFDPTLPSTDPAACPAGQKTGMTQTRVTTDANGLYVTGVLVCYDPTSRASTFGTSVLYVLPGTVASQATLSRFAVYTSRNFVAALPPQLSAGATAAWFPQLQPAKLQDDPNADAPTTAVFVAQVSFKRVQYVSDVNAAVCLWYRLHKPLSRLCLGAAGQSTGVPSVSLSTCLLLASCRCCCTCVQNLLSLTPPHTSHPSCCCAALALACHASHRTALQQAN